ncbi:MAG TPA: hypothetical protein DCP28_02915, partial [Cytophagales bacterium]|nr:hypothetical protein [Cytophagales bacterium]
MTNQISGLYLRAILLLFSLGLGSKAFSFQNFTDFVVTTAADSGAGSLNEALLAIDGQPGAHRITFASGLQGQSIPYNVSLSNVVDTLIIDGDTDGDDVADITLDGQDQAVGLLSMGTGAHVELQSIIVADIAPKGSNSFLIEVGEQGSLSVRNCTFQNFTGTLFQVVDRQAKADVSVENCNIGNQGTPRDASVLLAIGDSVSVRFSGCDIYGFNFPTAFRYLFNVWGGSLSLENSLVHDNLLSTMLIAQRDLSPKPADIYLRHVTVANNTIQSSFGNEEGVFILRSANLQADNSLIIGNTYSSIGRIGPEIYVSVESSYTPTGTIFNPDRSGYFNNPSNGDFTLAKGSPAIDAGLFSRIGDFTIDLDGNPRPNYGFGTDAGALERQGAPTTTTYYYTVTNNATSGSGSLNAILDSVDETTGNHFINFDPGVAGHTIPFQRKINLTGSLTLLGDINGDRTADVTLASQGAITGITSSTRDIILTLEYVNFDSITTDSLAPQVFRLNTQGKLNVVGCGFTNTDGTWFHLVHPSRVITLQAQDATFEGNTGTNTVIYEGDGAGITATFTGITAMNNTAPAADLFLAKAGTLMVQNALLAGNQIARGVVADGDAHSSSQVSVSYATLANNTLGTDASQGMVTALFGSVDMENSLILSNRSAQGAARNTHEGAFGNLVNTNTTIGESLQGYFTNPGTRDYTLAPNSPALDAGDGAFASALTTDLAGNTRPTAGTAPDLGAYESSVGRLTVTNTLSEGAGSLHDVFETINGQPGDFIITFDPSLAGQEIPFNASIVQTTGSLTIDGDVDNDGQRDIALQGTVNLGKIIVRSQDYTLRLRHLRFTRFNTLNSARRSFEFNANGLVEVESCEFDDMRGILFSMRPSPYADTTQVATRFIATNSSFIRSTSFFSSIYEGLYPSTEATFKNCIVQRNITNTASLFYAAGSRLTLENCLITDNRGDQMIYGLPTNEGYQPTVVVRHGTIAHNQPGTSVGNAAIKSDAGSLQVFNSLVVANRDENGEDRNIWPSTDDSRVIAVGNQMVLKDSGYFTDTLAFDFTLLENSPAIDAGDASQVGGLTTDLAGNARIMGNGVDVGAYEFFVAPPSSDPAMVLALNLDTCAGTQLVDSISGENV